MPANPTTEKLDKSAQNLKEKNTQTLGQGKPGEGTPVSQNKGASENEGEGSKSAARNYDKGAEQFVQSGRVEKAAKDAEAALEGPEGEELRDAEEKAKGTKPEPPTTRGA